MKRCPLWFLFPRKTVYLILNWEHTDQSCVLTSPEASDPPLHQQKHRHAGRVERGMMGKKIKEKKKKGMGRWKDTEWCASTLLRHVLAQHFLSHFHSLLSGCHTFSSAHREEERFVQRWRMQTLVLTIPRHPHINPVLSNLI